MQTANDIFGALLWIVRFLGVAAIGYWLMHRLLRTRRTERFAVIVPLTTADAADRIYAMHLRLQWTGEGDRSAVIALDTGLDERTRADTARFCATIKNVYFCAPEELARILQKLQEET